MKKMDRIYIIAFIVGAVALQSCGGFKRVEKKQPLSVSPEKQELIVNQSTNPYTVGVNYVLKVPGNYVPSCGQLVYAVKFVTPEHEYALTPIVLTGSQYNRLEQRWQLMDGVVPAYPGAMRQVVKGKDMQIAVSEIVPFEMWMPQAKLVADVTLDACDKEKLMYKQTLADGVIYIPQGPGPVRVKYIQKEVIKSEEGTARFYYPVSSSVVDPALRDNRQQLEQMGDLIMKIKNDTMIRLHHIVITGVCSPEGSQQFNETLARKRAEFIQNYIIDHYQINPDLIEAKYIAADWNGLRTLVSESNLSDKEKILEIINRDQSSEQRVAALRLLPQYNYIKTNFFPQLRRVVYDVFYSVKEVEEVVVPE